MKTSLTLLAALLLNFCLFKIDLVQAACYPIYVESSIKVHEVPPSGIKRGAHVDPLGHSIDFNSQHYMKDGAPWLPVMGEIHYSRIPRESWNDILDKTKASGVNIIASYVFWIHHEEVEGTWEWSGNKDLGAFLDLCKKKGLYVLLRVGPWCHGEVRNGGFPDWLYKKGAKLRSNDPKYLDLCRNYFTHLVEKTKGRYFKDGGPIMAIQLENEYGWKSPAAAEYMYALKQMAVDLGIDVPIYTQFSPDYPPDQKEFVAMKGGYCDAPWGKGTQRQVREANFQFRGVVFDPNVGSDLFGERKETVTDKTFPSGMAEYGGGFQVTYQRRPCLFPGDIAAGAYVKIGSGANLLGYYMFHGGANPLGKISTLQESRKTKYPNDVPIISYDFQAPIGEWGQANEHLADLRLLHLALNDFGGRIAQMNAYLPQKKGPNGLRYAVRVIGDEGCLFFNNHTRYVPSPPIEGITFEIKSKGGESSIWPPKPISIQSDVYGFLPFGWNLEDVRLNWATAQPVCVLENRGVKTWVFAEIPGVVSEYDFAAASIKEKKVHRNLTEVVSAAGNRMRILTLTHAEALKAYKIHWGKEDYLVLSNAMVTIGDGNLRFQLWEGRELEWKTYPALPADDISQTSYSENFAKGSHTFPETGVEVRAIHPKTAEPMSDEIAKMLQPGPLYETAYKPVPGSTTWNLSVSQENGGAKDYLVEIEFNGDTIALYQKGKLVADDFQRGVPMRFLLNRIAGTNIRTSALQVQIVPFTKQRDVYLEKPELKTEGLVAGIKSIKAKPVYEMSLNLFLPKENGQQEIRSIPK